MFSRRVQIVAVRGAGVMQKSLFASQAIPVNLKLADESIFTPPPPAIASTDPYLYAFPRMTVPTETPVHIFQSPGSKASDSAPLNPELFGVAIRKDIVHDNVRNIRHQRRQPNKTKRMVDISGSNKKPKPQKGTGSSQVGNKRNSSWRGGFVAHGPVLRDFSIKINRKVRALGMMMVLSAKFREGNMFIVDQLKTETHKTKDLHALMTQHGFADSKTLFVDENFEENFLRSSRNLPLALSMERRHLNVYTILQYEKIVLPRDIFAKLQEELLSQYHHRGRMRKVIARQELLQSAQSA